MPGPPYFKPDNRAWIKVAWTTPQTTQVLEFLLDSGANRSAVQLPNALGLTLRSIVRAGTASAASQQMMLMGGGTMEFDVTDSQTGTATTVRYTGDVLVTSVDVVGTEVLAALRLQFWMNYSATPSRPELTT